MANQQVGEEEFMSTKLVIFTVQDNFTSREFVRIEREMIGQQVGENCIQTFLFETL